jgi:hypothetical protein
VVSSKLEIQTECNANLRHSRRHKSRCWLGDRPSHLDPTTHMAPWNPGQGTHATFFGSHPAIRGPQLSARPNFCAVGTSQTSFHGIKRERRCKSPVRPSRLGSGSRWQQPGRVPNTTRSWMILGGMQPAELRAPPVEDLSKATCTWRGRMQET